MKLNKSALLFLMVFTTLAFLACSKSSSNEVVNPEPDTSCSTIKTQSAQGKFRGRDFTYIVGYYQKIGTRYQCRLFTKVSTDSSCIFGTFTGDDDKILWSIPTLGAQTIVLNQTTSTLNFNRILASNSNTEIELADCGKIEILSYDDVTKKITGRLIAKGQQGSTVDGNFVLDLCTP